MPKSRRRPKAVQKKRQVQQARANDEVSSGAELSDWTPPKELGIKPQSLEDVAALIEEAWIVLSELLDRIAGCSVRLNLTALDRAVENARTGVGIAGSDFMFAKEAIEADVPLSRTFPDKEVDLFEHKSWIRAQDGASVAELLTPRQINYLAATAKKHDGSKTITYREALKTTDTIPPVVERRLEKLRAKKEHESWMLETLSKECPRCRAKPGEECISAAGRVTTPHVGRRPA